MNSGLFIVSEHSFRFVACGHENGVIDSRAELDRAYADRRDERQRLTHIMRESEVDEYCKFNNRNEYERKRKAAFNKHDYQEYCNY